MIINIDYPVMESGIGGSVHLEDLELVTQHGAQPIDDTANKVFILKALVGGN